MEHRDIYWDQKEEIVNLFVGKSVRKVDEATLLLSDGSVLDIQPNSGCGGCATGNAWLESLGECENIITNVEVVETPAEDYQTRYEIFVLSGNQKINLLRVDGYEDNGYYGEGYWIEVSKAD